ncbi:MAG: SDR family NAD(P)-dependent oxidoreductase [Clostridia bacterium]|nr:SDR family NAD(P)-dependent oxidoreductase [Clostridia bacterium]
MTNYTLITGAAGGLGSAFAHECASRGQNLLLTDIDTEKLENLIIKIEAEHKHIDIKYLSSDLTDTDERKRLFDYITDSKLNINLAVNVAGLDYEGLIYSLSSEKVSTMCRLNLEAAYDITRFVMTNAKAEKYHIINTASLAGFYPMPYKALYAATKSAVIRFSMALREEAGGRGNVLALCPAGLRTTPEVCARIDSQGFMGRITTIATDKVAKGAINRVLRNRAVYIPGIINSAMLAAASILPEAATAKIIYRRWGTRDVKL